MHQGGEDSYTLNVNCECAMINAFLQIYNIFCIYHGCWSLIACVNDRNLHHTMGYQNDREIKANTEQIHFQCYFCGSFDKLKDLCQSRFIKLISFHCIYEKQIIRPQEFNKMYIDSSMDNLDPPSRRQQSIKFLVASTTPSNHHISIKYIIIAHFELVPFLILLLNIFPTCPQCIT